MFKKLNIVFYLLLLTSLCFAAPSTTINVPNSFSPQTTIASSAMNANFNEITTKYNTHTHTDITQLGVVTSGTWAATPVQSSYVAQGAGSITGEVKLWAGTTSNIPSSFLSCDGTAVSRSTYSALFAIIGTNYGIGDGTTTFNLPAWNNGKFVKGSTTAGTSAGSDTSTATGTTDGHAVTQAELPNVNFIATAANANGSGQTELQATTNGASPASYNIPSGGSGTAHTHTFTSGTFSIVPTNQTGIFIIRT